MIPALNGHCHKVGFEQRKGAPMKSGYKKLFKKALKSRGLRSTAKIVK